MKSKIRLRQSTRIYLKKIPANFHLDPIWNKEAFRLFWKQYPNNNNKNNNNHDNKMSSDMESVANLKTKYLLSIRRFINPTDVAVEKPTRNIIVNAKPLIFLL